jgi:hypothetical protein
MHRIKVVLGSPQRRWWRRARVGRSIPARAYRDLKSNVLRAHWSFKKGLPIRGAIVERVLCSDMLRRLRRRCAAPGAGLPQMRLGLIS